MSADFHRHATSMLMVQALEHIDPDRYELYFYSAGPDDGTALRTRVLATASVVHEVATWSGARIAEQIAADQIGVLFDLKGFTKGARLDITAAHPAPLQVAWLGFPGTIGTDHIDYVIGDPVVTPLEHQADFTETIAQLPHCYQPNDALRSRPAVWSRAQCGLPHDALVLASFNQPFKITPQMFAAWCRVLQAVPRAVLWMLVPEPATRARLCAAAAALGIATERLVFAPFVEIERHRARLPQADLLLDTFPCSGHTTASDGLWAGVPMVTLIGRTFAARVAASLLHTLGLDELVFSDVDDYVAKAIELCRVDGALAQLRERIVSARLTSALFDGVRFAADLQALIDRMVERQDAGLAPAPLPAQQRISAASAVSAVSATDGAPGHAPAPAAGPATDRRTPDAALAARAALAT
jgi:predicted O-linked N-acetylglucosamine transferase (SPINDLY family)